MSVLEFQQSNEWLKKYYDRGFRLIFYGAKKKGPEGQEAVGWTERSDKIEDYQPGQNVGTFTGHEISPGKFLVDVDFDYAEGLPLSKRILPSTDFGFGRESRYITHSFFTTDSPIPSLVFDNIDGKPLVELRCTKQDGSVGQQTMIPISVHPGGEKLILRADEVIGHSPDIARRVTIYAVACILYSNLGHKGLTHDIRLAVAGFLLSEGLSVDETIVIGEAIAEATGNNIPDVKTTVTSSAERLKLGGHVLGKGLLLKSLGEDGKRIIGRIKEWIGSRDFIEDTKGKILAGSQENVRRALEKCDVILSYDVFSDKAMITYPKEKYAGPLVDVVVTSARFEIDNRFHFLVQKDFFFDVVTDIAHKNKFHPVIDYLKSLEWDQEPRVDSWLIRSASAVDSDYVRAVSSIFLLAAVRRVTHPGSKYDEMVVLESGEQGLFKSSALRALCPHERWFSDDLPLNVDAKQIVERTAGKWIIEASDLSGMHISQVEHLKGMLSRQVDGPVRLAYGRLPVEQPRQFIIVGTTNSYTYLSDTTGNRRFWPIRVQKFDVDWIKENRDQLWAEAYARGRSGESIRLNPLLYGHATIQQERRRAEDPWEVKLDEVFPWTEKHRLSMDEIWAPLGISIDKRDPRATDRILKVMHRLKFRRVTVRSVDNRISRGFGRDIDMSGEMEPTDD